LTAAWKTLAAVVMLAGGCVAAVPPSDQVAVIDDQPLSHLEFEEFLGRNSVDGAGVLGSDVLSSLLDQFLDEQLLARLAADRLEESADLDARSAAQALVEITIQEPDDATVARYFQENQSRFDLPERVYLRQILFTDRAVADKARNLWVQGAPYQAVVDELADDRRAHVGEEGEFSRQDLPPAFAETLFDLADSEVTEVLAADYGFHVFQVVSHHGAGVVSLQDAADGIRRELNQLQREEALILLAAEARERYNVRVFERNLPFNYLGRYGSKGHNEDS